MDGLKVMYQLLSPANNAKYGVIYENGRLTKNWI
jgi:hypothetical protein